jgi:hypothetical protein
MSPSVGWVEEVKIRKYHVTASVKLPPRRFRVNRRPESIDREQLVIEIGDDGNDQERRAGDPAVD